jgi:flagellar hook assembly protein FlgD
LENYPNPFHESTTITCQLSENAHVTLAILNMMGQTVNVLVNRDQSAGTFEVEWNGTDAAGTELPSGIYIYRLSTDKVQLSRRLILIR